jgi:hypothetical protein
MSGGSSNIMPRPVKRKQSVRTTVSDSRSPVHIARHNFNVTANAE